MSGLDRRGYAQGSYAPRVGYQTGSMWNPLNWFKRGVPVKQFGPISESYYRTHTMAPESAYKNLEQRIASKAKGLGSRLWSMVPEEGLMSKATRAAPITTGAATTAGLPIAYTYLAHKLQESLPEQLTGEGGIAESSPYSDPMAAGADISPNVDRILRGEEIDIEGKPLKPEKNETENKIIKEEENLKRKSDIETIYGDMLPMIERELGADPDDTKRQLYVQLAQAGANLLAEPGGDLVGAIGKAAKGPISTVGKVLEKESATDREAKLLAFKLA